MPVVGLSNFHYALMTAVDTTLAAATYGSPVKVAGLINADIKVSSNSTTLFADNGPVASATCLGAVSLSIELADLDLPTQAALMGHTVALGVMTCANTDITPYVAVSFEYIKDDGKKRFVKLLKGHFGDPSDSVKTKEDKVAFATGKIDGDFVCRLNDGQWKVVADEGATGYVSTTGTGWYTTM